MGGGPGRQHTDWADTVYWAGLGLLGLALACAGGGLVSRSALWLRVIVALAFPLLVWSVYAVVKGDDDAVMLDGVLGAVADRRVAGAFAAGGPDAVDGAPLAAARPRLATPADRPGTPACRRSGGMNDDRTWL